MLGNLIGIVTCQLSHYAPLLVIEAVFFEGRLSELSIVSSAAVGRFLLFLN